MFGTKSRVLAVLFFCLLCADSRAGEIANVSFTSATLQLADTYSHCNFAQPAPVLDAKTGKWRGVRIFGDDLTTRTFIKCNLTNVEVPAGSVVVGCNRALIRQVTKAVAVDVITPVGVVKVLPTGMERLGMYTSAGIVELLATPVFYEDAKETDSLLEERAGLVARIAEIDAKLTAKLPVGEVVK